jgi:phosphatidate cytidylyltransferase
MSAKRLFDYRSAFDHPVTLWITVGVAGILILTPIAILILSRLGALSGAIRREIVQRYLSWLIIAPVVMAPVLLGAAWTIGAVAFLSIICYGEYSRSTGLFREKLTCLVVVLGILLISFATLNHWYAFFVALISLVSGTIAATAIVLDRPKGYIERVGLGIFGFMFFGVSLGHVGFMANDSNYRPIVLMLLLGVQLNDVFAFVVGKTFGRRRIAPQTSPHKTVAGSAGALLLTTPLVAFLGHHIFRGTPLDHPCLLTVLGILTSVTGQLGDLMLSSIKRDIGVKDMGTAIAGHGGILDRCNSVVLAAPAVFHYIHYYVGFGLGQPQRIITGE